MKLLNDNVLLALTNTNISGRPVVKCLQIKQSCGTFMLYIYKILSVGIYSNRGMVCYFKYYLECCLVQNFHSECPGLKEDF